MESRNCTMGVQRFTSCTFFSYPKGYEEHLNLQKGEVLSQFLEGMNCRGLKVICQTTRFIQKDVDLQLMAKKTLAVLQPIPSLFFVFFSDHLVSFFLFTSSGAFVSSDCPYLMMVLNIFAFFTSIFKDWLGDDIWKPRVLYAPEHSCSYSNLSKFWITDFFIILAGTFIFLWTLLPRSTQVLAFLDSTLIHISKAKQAYRTHTWHTSASFKMQTRTIILQKRKDIERACKGLQHWLCNVSDMQICITMCKNLIVRDCWYITVLC